MKTIKITKEQYNRLKERRDKLEEELRQITYRTGKVSFSTTIQYLLDGYEEQKRIEQQKR